MANCDHILTNRYEGDYQSGIKVVGRYCAKCEMTIGEIMSEEKIDRLEEENAELRQMNSELQTERDALLEAFGEEKNCVVCDKMECVLIGKNGPPCLFWRSRKR